MIVLVHFLNAIAGILDIIFRTLIIFITARVILSWVNPDPYNPIVRFIITFTDPLIDILKPLRRYLSPPGSRVDFTPYVLMLLIIFLQYFLPPVLQDYAIQLRREAI